MATLAARRSVIDGLSANRRAVLRVIVRRLQLGQPAIYEDRASVEWYVWDDHRIDFNLVALVGALAVAFNQIPDDYTTEGKTRQQVQDDVRRFVDQRFVDPDSVDLKASSNPYQSVLDAQGAPVIMKADSGVPAELTVSPTADT